ncbi:amidohydrolase family protein [Streptomyces sp. NPDC057963]|uniref:amidohydrolase family protein n=1 Tax=Streptomyces sp. NPDC057963 TaxID=3346290 RepID=UPI0036E5823B
MIPGLNDSHLHVIRGGLNYVLELRWDGLRTLREGLAMLREQAAHTPKGQWVQGYEAYVVTDASGGVSPQAHEHAIQRMVQGGAIPVTWVQVLLELQRDWARTETYVPVGEVVKEHGGAYGLGLVYAQAVIGAHAAG